jgi:hypothetical protein
VDTIKDNGIFFFAHGILNSSIVNSNANTNPIGNTDSLFIASYRYKRDNNKIPLLFLYRAFQKIRKAAYSQGLLTLTPDSLRLKDVIGRQTSPYNNGQIFAFSPFQNDISESNSVNFALPSQLWLMPGITSVQVDFGDGAGFRTLNQNSTISIYYPASGQYVLTANITVSGNILTAKSLINYTKPNYYVGTDSVWNISVPPIYSSIADYVNQGSGLLSASSTKNLQTIQSLSGTSSCSEGNVFTQANCDINPGATVTIENGCDRVFDKPIIIVEGFDPELKVDYKTLTIQFSSVLNQGSVNFYDVLRAQGYDFVFVVFTKNWDFIENNAAVLEQVIRKVNAVKTGSNKISIVGYSMGGLIARYALRDMENQGISHNVLNYFSYDAPHQGANVPMGLQCIPNELLIDLTPIKYISSFKKIIGAYSSAAAMSMIALYATYIPSYPYSVPSSSPLSFVRSIFAQRLINLGYPQTTQNYAISNGRGDNTAGTTNAGNGAQWNNFGPGTKIFDGGGIFYLENFSAQAYAVPVNTMDYILRYRFSGLKPGNIFGFPSPYWAIRIRNIKLFNNYPYDDAPGGCENTQAQFVSKFNGVPINGKSSNDNTHFGHNFISVASALDLKNQNYNSTNQFQSSNLFYNVDANISNPGTLAGNTISSTVSPFQFAQTYTSDCNASGCNSRTDDSYLLINGYPNPLDKMGVSWNLWHEANISSQTSYFLMRKILNTNVFAACTISNSLCSRGNLAVSGPSGFCTTATYTIANFGGIQDINIQWSCPNGTCVVIAGQGTPTATMSRIGDGNETITAILSNRCNQSATYTLPNVAVGSPNSLTGTYTGSAGTKPLLTFNTVPVGNIAGNYTWTGITNISISHSGSGTWSYGSSNTFGFYLNTGQNMNLTFNGTGNCGAVNATRTFLQSGGFSVVASPNPTSDNININIIPSDDTTTSTLKSSANTTSNKLTSMSIYDINSGRLVRKWDYQEAEKMQYILNIIGINKGIYVLKVTRNNFTSSIKIIVD